MTRSCLACILVEKFKRSNANVHFQDSDFGMGFEDYVLGAWELDTVKSKVCHQRWYLLTSCTFYFHLLKNYSTAHFSQYYYI